MTTPHVADVADYKRLNDTREVVVATRDLPLHCPMDAEAVWCAHPRVFLPIETAPDKTYRCPYCGTLYRLL